MANGSEFTPACNDPGDESKTDARKKANDFVRDELNQGPERDQRRRRNAASVVCDARDAGCDFAGPCGFPEYTAETRSCRGHIWEELFDPGKNSNLDKATDLAYKYYKGELPMPKDFFENICADNFWRR